MTVTPSSVPEPPRPIEVRAGDSPANAAVPFWVTACVRLAPPVGRTGKPTEAADKVITAAQVLLADRVRTQGDDRVLATREVLAAFCGYNRSDKVRWITDYLERIGFLRVRDEQRDKRGRRRNRVDPTTGQSTPDEFLVREQPPMAYAGPTDFAELRDALAAGRAWSLDELFRPFPSRWGPAPKPQVNPGPHREGPSEGERERTLSESSLPRSIEESVSSPATGGPGDDTLNRQIRDELVRRMPWQRFGHRLTVADEQRLVPPMVAAIREHGMSFEQVTEHALWKLSHAGKNPPSWVAGAFEEPSRLPVPTHETLTVPTSQPDSSAPHTSSPRPSPESPMTGTASDNKSEPQQQPASDETRRRVREERKRLDEARKARAAASHVVTFAQTQGQEHTA